tara:strand:- start:5428 stop:6462 length:1035 start_codon:yes stop_codon:yes gene_type:complete
MDALYQYKNFPSSRYMGSKNKIIPKLYEVFKNNKFQSAIDLFSGSSSVSYLLKSMGKKVISNDYLSFASNISSAIISNNKTKLSKKDLNHLITRPKNYDKFVQTKFNGIFFSKEENDFIDIVRHNVQKLNNVKKSIALAALVKACQKKQPRGLFTFKGFRYDDGRLDLKKNIKDQFFDAVNVFNNSIFNNNQKNIVLNKNFINVNNEADLIYIDPPYFSKLSDNGYVRRYHFLEGIVRSWKGVEIQEKSVVKKFKNYPSMFDTELGSKSAIELLIKKYSKKIIVFSYSSNSLPNINFFKETGKKNKMRTYIKKINYTYSFGTQKKNTSMKNKVEEFIITMKRDG